MTSAGVLRTAEGMQQIHMDGWLPLFELAESLLMEEGNARQEKGFEWNVLASLFYLRIVNVLIRPPFRNLKATGKLMTALRSFVQRADGNSARLRFWRLLLSSTFDNDPALCHEIMKSGDCCRDTRRSACF